MWFSPGSLIFGNQPILLLTSNFIWAPKKKLMFLITFQKFVCFWLIVGVPHWPDCQKHWFQVRGLLLNLVKRCIFHSKLLRHIRIKTTSTPKVKSLRVALCRRYILQGATLPQIVIFFNAIPRPNWFTGKVRLVETHQFAPSPGIVIISGF